MTNYNGVLGENLHHRPIFAEEVRVPQDRRHEHDYSRLAVPHARRAPGTTNGQHYHAPFFAASDPEDRDNTQYAGSVSYS